MQTRVTLDDVSKATGFSKNTISRALRGKKDISAQTTEYIRGVAQKMGYVSNNVASALRSGKTNIIAVIVDDLINPFYSLACNLLQQDARCAGYSIMIMCSRGDPEIEMEVVKQAVSHCVDGVLLFPTAGSGPAVETLRSAKMPFVLMTRYLYKGRDDCVLLGDEKGGYLAASHLLAAGHKKIAYLSLSDVIISSASRKAGFVKACRDAGLSPSNYSLSEFPRSNMEFSAVPEWKKEVLGELKRLKTAGFTGLFIFCDSEAWQITGAMKESEEFSDDDFGIVGFDNISSVMVMYNSLCSIDCNMPDVCSQGFGLLLKRINGDSSPVKAIICEPKLVCRGSCKGPLK